MLSFRNKLKSTDPKVIADIASSTGFFDSRDVRYNVDIVNHLLHNQDSSHKFLFAEENGKTVAYACFEELPDARVGSYELCWLSTLNECRGRGIGRQLMEYLISHLRSLGARHLYLKTESTAQYEPTRRFYEKCGFTLNAVLPNYYGANSDCCIYCLNMETDELGIYCHQYAAAE